jgi:zinc protease
VYEWVSRLVPHRMSRKRHEKFVPQPIVMDGNQLRERIQPVEHRLDNGLTLLVREDHSSPVVAVVTHVGVGYFDEPDPLVGISHVLEHMYFKGTERRGVGDIARQTKAAGGYLNAGTIYDHTSYYTVLPSSAVDMGLEIQADALTGSVIDEEELRKELLVIIQEVKRKLDNPAALATEKLYEALFDVHPMRRWRMGTEEALRRLERSDVFDYYRRMYRAGAITLVVSGDVDPARVIDRVESLYGVVPPGEPERLDRTEPDRDGARLRQMSGDIGHTYAEVGWRSPGALDADTPAMDALAVILGQGRASRLYRGVRDQGLVSSIDAYNYTPREIGVFGISLECEPERAADALVATGAEVAAIRDRAVEADELERVVTLLEARLLRRLETAEGQANLLAEWEAMGGWRGVGDFLDGIRDLTPDDIRRVARGHLDPARITVLVYRPDEAAPLTWDDADLPDRLARGRPRERAGTPAPGDVEAADTAARAPLVLGAPRTEDGVIQHDLDGGRLVVLPRSRAPLVSMSVTHRGGVLHEAPATAGITSLMMRASVKGTADRDAAAIARATERLGGGISASAGSDLLSWSLTVPAQHFAEGFSLLAEVATRPSFPDGEVEREKRVLLADLAALRDDMYRFPMQLLLQAAFGDHPYGLGPDRVETAVRDLDPAALRGWHRRELAEPWVVVVGDVDPDRVAEVVADTIPSTAREVRTVDTPAEWSGAPTVRSVSRDRAQSALALAFPGPDRTHPDRIPLQVLGNAITGLGNRLFEELRSRRSLAYTVVAHPIVRRHGGAFVGYIATSPSRTDEAREELVRELLRLRDDPPTEEELERARRYTIGAWQIRTQTNAARLSQLAGALMLGTGLEEIRTFEDRVDAVTRDDVLDVARRWFDPDRLVEGAVHGAD